MGRLTEALAPYSTRRRAFLGGANLGRRGRRIARGPTGHGQVEWFISIMNDKAIAKALYILPDRNKRFALRPALRASSLRLRTAIVQHLSGIPVGPESGAYLTAMAGQKPVLIKGQRQLIGYVLKLPTRAALDIAPDDPWYYPMVLEVGSPKDPARYPAYAPVRTAVNANMMSELNDIRRHVYRGVERQWERLTRKAKRLVV